MKNHHKTNISNHINDLGYEINLVIPLIFMLGWQRYGLHIEKLSDGFKTQRY